ncbi:MAG: MFS family multidrug efflux protein, similarity to bicyclomycin resistance protein Bcr [uncultured Thiotrichaceae bacterium]|uniref:Bcr/CflA family efflux transporter n=1 Tax=uncultured Thiotrichaceae bacterium TaxID=298394 RepID=A0A6S6TQ37_9GAMM|nr:MAG: MFS family multidrug efflux protein, similarity to bicyclomycin resistance protein Bcr [uncultured Thiotrichaceae bacterium]
MAKKLPGFVELVILIAMLSSLAALAIDAMLPAMSQIGQDLQLAHENDVQLIITVLFLGMALGQLVFGPLSDSTGRKPMMYLGLVVFMIGSVLSMVAEDFFLMLLGRFLQGFGSAAPRSLTTAIVRDHYAGRQMARIMSFTFAVFILVPMLAPFMGQGILQIADWRAIFGTFLILSAIVYIWFMFRMPETLSEEHRRPFSFSHTWNDLRDIISMRSVALYTLITGLLFGAFLGYLSSIQQILQLQYGLAERFPFYFALLAFGIGFAAVVNAKLVLRFGMHWLCHQAIRLLTVLAAFFLLGMFLNAEHPPLWMFMCYLVCTLFGMGILFGNLNALAMEPLGKMAGLGASVIGAISTFISVPLGALIGYFYNGTVLPLVLGFFVLGLISLVLMRFADAARRNETISG